MCACLNVAAKEAAKDFQANVYDNKENVIDDEGPPPRSFSSRDDKDKDPFDMG